MNSTQHRTGRQAGRQQRTATVSGPGPGITRWLERWLTRLDPLAAGTRRRGTVLGLLVCAGLLTPGLSTGRTWAASSVLGKRAIEIAPTCPEGCQVVSRVTGFQLRVQGVEQRPQAPRDGWIEGWRVRLGQPDLSQTGFFRLRLGSIASARLTVLRPAGGSRFRAVAESPVEELNDLFWGTRRFALHPAISVRRGDLVALTVPAWAPALAAGPNITPGSAWAASRQPPCSGTLTHAEQQPGETRHYGCIYRTAVLTYAADFRTSRTPAAPLAKSCGQILNISGITATRTSCAAARAVVRGWIRTLKPGRRFVNRIGSYRCVDLVSGDDADVLCKGRSGRRVRFYFSE